jgi:hypothetical protein
VHVVPASPQSLLASQITYSGAGHDTAHVDPVKPVGSIQLVGDPVAVQPMTGVPVYVPVPQQTGPGDPAPAQSTGERQCQSIAVPAGHVVALAIQVEGAEDDAGVSQQC